MTLSRKAIAFTIGFSGLFYFVRAAIALFRNRRDFFVIAARQMVSKKSESQILEYIRDPRKIYQGKDLDFCGTRWGVSSILSSRSFGWLRVQTIIQAC